MCVYSTRRQWVFEFNQNGFVSMFFSYDKSVVQTNSKNENKKIYSRKSVQLIFAFIECDLFCSVFSFLGNCGMCDFLFFFLDGIDEIRI